MSIFDVRLRVYAQDTLDVWWYYDQFAEFFGGVPIMPKHPIQSMRSGDD